MKDQTRSAIELLEALTERAKELRCLYAIEEALKDPDADIDLVCERIIQAIPPGWQFPEICLAKISLEDKGCQSPDFQETPWKLNANIVRQDQVVGTIGVYYTRDMPAADIGPFLKEEKKLIESIADRINHFLTYKKMKHVFQERQIGEQDPSGKRRADWEAVLDLIRQTDHAFFLRISNKMLNHLCWSGIEEAEELRRAQSRQDKGGGSHHGDEVKEQHTSRLLDFSTEFTQRIFRLAGDHLSGDEILSRIQMWIHEDKLGALLRTVRRHLPLADVSRALRRYFITTQEEIGSRYPLAKGLKVLLIETVLSDRMEYIKRAKDHVDIEDLYQLLQKVIFSNESHGRLGGKSAGLFLASQVLKKTKEAGGPISTLRIPKTWYISSDMMLEFMHYNNMDEIIEQKYKEIERVRLEYPHVTDLFQHMAFPPEMVTGLSMALDELGPSPLIVRSSSLLEDRAGTTFVDKYKSVFLGNQGTREDRLRDLMRAVAEVYASNFGPEPIEYRADRGLLEFSEQMGVMIQEVVGSRIGPFFLPVYSGVARSRNDFHWSPEINAEDGIIRIIPGLGTRIMDRIGNERPVLVVPGRPSLKVEKSIEDRIRHAPKRVDVINLETNRLQTVEVQQILKDFGDPNADQVVSVYEDGEIRPLDKEKADFEKDLSVVTFDGLISRSPFVLQIRDVLRTLEKKLGGPVEIEFASDGEHLYLLQCRSLALTHAPRPAPIPKDLTRDKVIFSATRHVSNGWASNITHIVYVDPAGHEALEEPSHHEAVEQAVANLNEILPKRQFIFMAPGRWSVHGNGRGGMDVNYSDVNNAAVLVELIKPEKEDGTTLSFGIHFLQDLAESDIRYLPVFPDDEGIRFNELFLKRSRNLLPELLPDYAFLADVVRVIDVPKVADGKVVQVLMNAELDEAVAFLAEHDEEMGPEQGQAFEDEQPENYWRWRYGMAEQIASLLDPSRFGVEGFYLFGSTKNGTAGPASDIDLLIHFKGTKTQRQTLVQWLEGWSLCLDEINYLRTGYRSGGLLDVHLVTDEDIAKRTSYAVKINAVTDAARPLKMRKKEQAGQPISETNELSIREGVN